MKNYAKSKIELLKDMVGRAIIGKRSSKSKGMKYSRRHRCHYIVVDAFVEDMAVRGFM